MKTIHSNDNWELIENAGYDGELVVKSSNSYSDIKQSLSDQYTENEIEKLHVAIKCNGSYEW